MNGIRLDLEKDFHDKRFEHGDNREAQLKYYWAVADGADVYHDKIVQAARGARILEYGCATGTGSIELAADCVSYDGIDISDVAIAHAKELYGRNNVRFHAMDAMNMSFEDGSFDLIYGSGIIHHLDTEVSMKEIRRVLAPGGVAYFWEPLGHNPLINAYRAMTPAARTPDEHPLLRRDFELMRKHYSTVNVSYYGLSTLAAVPFRNSAVGGAMKTALRTLDKAIFAVPGVRDLAWYTIIELRP